ncbi:histidine kinase [Marinicauda pacifica]|jgi:CBS domain-containing protein|uniref:CBS domain-containing protein n=1 Tax=Marinicauda pacifica TaxID=1133559 RepID=A0A4S2HDJ2_9PROT|nr:MULTISPECIES: CBS domain-containing protein [Marinicauda]TGY94064.1 CBS domain-containing protein [Marinicauda pacifica]GGE32552.1 histidine kinase [Marinicauda pacifica]
MSASRILSQKGSDIFSVSPDTTLLDAARELTERRIGAVVVLSDDREPVGVFSERDLARALAEGGPSVLDQAVTSVMTRDLITAAPETDVDDLMSLMTGRRVRHILIVKDDRLQGVVSIGDVVKRKIAEAEAEAESLKTYIETA